MSFKAGDAVVHKIFGKGKVLKATPMGNDVLYEVEFADGNVKKLMGNYANMTAQN